MKSAILVRHAKSSWANLDLADIDRPLNSRGLRDAPFMATKLASEVPEIDLIISSTATRARQTSHHFSPVIKHSDVRYDEALYHASSHAISDVIRDISSRYTRVLLFGHNPGFTDMFNLYSDDSLDNLPTCGIFCIDIDGEWTDLDPSRTTVRLLMYPKLYR